MPAESAPSRWSLFQRALLRFWPFFLVLGLGSAIWAGRLLPDFAVEAGTDVLLNEDDDDLYYYNASRADWGTDEYIIVCCHRNDGWFTPDALKLLNELIDRLKKSPHAKSITAITTVPLLRNQPTGAFGRPMPITIIDKEGRLDPKVDLEKAKNELMEHTQALGNLISEKGLDTSILVYLDLPEDEVRYESERNGLLGRPRDPEAKKRLKEIEPLYQLGKKELMRRRVMLVNETRTIAKEWSSKFDEPIRLSGLSFVNILLTEHIHSDITTFGILSFALFTVTYFIIYRRIRWVVLPVLTCVLPVAIMLAIMVSTGKKVTVVTSNMPVLLFILLLPYSVYFIERYCERRSADPAEDPKVTATRAPLEIWLPCLYSCLATMAGTAAHMPSGINPVRTFGLIMTIAMGIGLAFVMLFLPSSVVPLKGIHVTGFGATSGVRGPLKLLLTLVLRAPLAVVIASFVILGLSIWGTTRITVETKFINYFWPRSPIYQGLDYIDNRMGGTTPVEVILRSDKPGFFRTTEGLAALDAAARFFDKTKVPETGNVRSFKTFLDEFRKTPFMVKMKDETLAKTVIGYTGRKLEWTCSVCGKVHVEALKDGIAKEPRDGDDRNARCKFCQTETTQRLTHVELGMVDEFCNWNFTVSRVLVRMRETAPTLNRNRILRDLRAHLDSLKNKELKGVEARPTGIFLLYANMLNTLIKATRDTFVLAVISIFLMLCILFRSPLLAIIVLLPQVLPVFLVLGTMGFTGIALDMVTVIIASVAMGVGIDAAIQYTVRFRKEQAIVEGDIAEAIKRSHATIGRAILIATSIVFAGFAILMLSNFVPTFYFGLFTGLAILMGLFASLSTLPSMFMLLKYPKLKK